MQVKSPGIYSATSETEATVKAEYQEWKNSMEELLITQGIDRKTFLRASDGEEPILSISSFSYVEIFIEDISTDHILKQSRKEGFSCSGILRAAGLFTRCRCVWIVEHDTSILKPHHHHRALQDINTA